MWEHMENVNTLDNIDVPGVGGWPGTQAVCVPPLIPEHPSTRVTHLGARESCCSMTLRVDGRRGLVPVDSARRGAGLG